MTDADPFDLLGPKIEAAKSGDTEAAAKLLKEFCASVRQNRRGGKLGAEPLVRPVGNTPYSHTAFDERLLDYLAECFERVGNFEGSNVRSVTAGQALNLESRRKGRKTSQQTLPDSRVRGLRVYELYHDPKRNISLEDAYEEVARIESKSAETVKKDYQGWLALLRQFAKEIDG